jgi:pyruvate/2-oxoacid:ferredoxin oxidoreductase beta subunit
MSIQEPPAPVNLIGLTRNDYKGLPSTLCKGCGHDSISARIISVAYDLSINPRQLIKMSGIGCSSKLELSHCDMRQNSRSHVSRVFALNFTVSVDSR